MLAAGLWLLLLPQVPAAEPDLAAELARLVDLPTAAERQRAADQLARRDVALADWLRAAAAFGSFAPLEPGPARETVELQVLDQVERTDVCYYVPRGYDPARPAPLLLVGHGSGGTGAREYLRWQAVADRLGMLVLAPSESGPNVGWGFTPRERQAQLAALRWLRRRANVDENRVYLTGISRGGHMAWDLLLRCPGQFAAAAPCIGGPRLQLQGGQNNLRFLEHAAALPIRDLQGSGDDPLLLADLRQAFAALAKLGAADARLIEFAGRGHDFDQDAVDWAQFFTAVRQPVPQQVVLLCAEAPARAFWIEVLQVDRKVAVEFAPQVDARAWERLDEAGRRQHYQQKIDERTARLQVELQAPGRFVASGRLVRKFRLLLTAAMLDADGKAQVRWQGREHELQPRPAAAVLLREFAERFDRGFLPIAELVLP